MIVPAVIPTSLEDIHTVSKKFCHIVSTIHIDVVDTTFAPTASWPIIDTSATPKDVDVSFMEIEVDIMSTNIQENIEWWTHAGAERFILHIASGIDKVEEAAKMCSQKGKEYALAFTIHDNLTAIDEHLIKNASFLQCMGIDPIGVQGRPFEKEALSLLEFLYITFQKSTIGIDGGVNNDTIRQIIDAGATHIVSGSYLTQCDDPKLVVSKWNQLLYEKSESK